MVISVYCKFFYMSPRYLKVSACSLLEAKAADAWGAQPDMTSSAVHWLLKQGSQSTPHWLPLWLSSSLLPTKASRAGGQAKEKLTPLQTSPWSHLKSECSHWGSLNPPSLQMHVIHCCSSEQCPPPQKACFVGHVLLLCRSADIHPRGTFLSIISAFMWFAYCVFLVFTKHKCKQRQRLKQSFQNTRAHTKDTHEHQILKHEFSPVFILGRRDPPLHLLHLHRWMNRGSLRGTPRSERLHCWTGDCLGQGAAAQLLRPLQHPSTTLGLH